MRRSKLAFALVALGLLTCSAKAGIVGSKHDFSGSTWSGGEICKPCHTPHGATVKDSAGNDIGAPIWNRSLPSSTSYKMYIGGVATDAQEIDSNSILCMSCHDGTIALDSFGGATGSTVIGTGSGANAKANLGTDLTTDHPVGAAAVWPTGAAYMVDPSVRTAAGIMPLRTLASNGKQVVGCSSCHEPHNRKNQPKLLWVSNSGTQKLADGVTTVPGSALCLNCHKK